MPRRKSTTSAAPAPPPSSKSKSHKRTLSSSATATPTGAVVTTPGSRASKRLKESATNTPTTAKKSKYFDGPASDEDEDEDEDSPSADEEASEFADTDNDLVADPSSASPSLPASEDEDDYDSEADDEREKPKKRGSKPRRKPAAATRSGASGIVDTVVEAGKELWRTGVKTGLGPGKQVFIERPKPRGDGGIKYVPDRIHPNTMAFLADLKKNNDREWLKMHDPDYRTSWNDWSTFVESLTEKIAEKDETIPELPPKDLVFRIYRDIRFSSDPTPYKTHFSAAWSRTGRKGPYACYYVQIAPGGGSFVGAGLWMPEAQPLALLRRNIDRTPEVIRRVLTDEAFRKTILGVVPNDAKKAIKAFASHNAENALKTKPKGYDADNPNIELLRLRNFTIGKKISDEQVTSPSGLDTIVDLVGTMTPFVTYLNDVVMPDSTGSSTESGSESGEPEVEEED